VNSELHGMSSLPVLKGFWLNRPRIRLSRSCVCVGGLGFGMVVRFVCVIRVPVFPVCPVCVPLPGRFLNIQKGNDHEAARTHSLDSWSLDIHLTFFSHE
jgi:hypothetical protein